MKPIFMIKTNCLSIRQRLENSVCMVCFFVVLSLSMSSSSLSSSSCYLATHALQSSAHSVGPKLPSSSKIRSMEQCGLVDPYEKEHEEITGTSATIAESTSPTPFTRHNIMDFRKRSRRDVLLLIKVPSTIAAVMAAALTTTTTTIASCSTRPALAFSLPFIPQKERRQLEVCLVAIMRVTYWAEKLVLDMSSNSVTSDIDRSSSSNDIVFLSMEQIDQRQRQAYLEARLGAKAILTGKIGSGATARVYDLAAVKLVDCLTDIDYYYSTISSSTLSGDKKKTKLLRATQFSDLQRDFYEALATLVEFDGYDTLPDASPRSTLLLQQYNPDKLVFVRRMLMERLIPFGNQLVNSFSSEAIATSQYYVQKYYPNEIIVTPSAAAALTSSKAAPEMEQRIL